MSPSPLFAYRLTLPKTYFAALLEDMGHSSTSNNAHTAIIVYARCLRCGCHYRTALDTAFLHL